MAVFMLQFADGDIALERMGQHDRSERLQTYRAEAVTAMILTAGRAMRTEAGDVVFERVDARGNWSRICTITGGQVKAAYARKTGEDGVAR